MVAVPDADNLTVLEVDTTRELAASALQTSLRANIADNSEIINIETIPSKYNDRVIILSYYVTPP
jgi:hypothetical protein